MITHFKIIQAKAPKWLQLIEYSTLIELSTLLIDLF